MPRTSAVRLVHYNLQPQSTPNAYELTLCSYDQYSEYDLTNLMSLSEMRIRRTKARNFAKRHLQSLNSISDHTLLYDFESLGCSLPFLKVLKYLTETPCMRPIVSVRGLNSWPNR